ncbi:MAG: lipid-A-disaccharide synthase [Acidiferrobacteraceae bacterium]|nr:lipid-A-disaccharide synthase [Acidiferrobacteraceae bacterium]|tara:strand:+ start:918 stop:2063 length:1146 start_codon:yes stop_codon:yes gene_type:complete
MRIGVVAGEASGDALGAGLLRSLSDHVIGGVKAEGIVGPMMEAEGAKSLFPVSDISLIGVDGLISNFQRLVRIRRILYNYYCANPPDIFIGIDLPDFNLGLEYRLRKAGVRTIHYVSPTVWAWRSWRIRKIKQAVDHMLVLFPFEAEYFRAHKVPVTFVGHPSADLIPTSTTHQIRETLGLKHAKQIVALLPGSREREVIHLGAHFLQAAALLNESHHGTEFCVAYSSSEIKEIFRRQMNQLSINFPIHEFSGNSLNVMAASDAVLLASGTASLEAAMLGKPMVVAYKVSAMSYRIARWVATTDFIAMPNNLGAGQVVPEVLQTDVSGMRLAKELGSILADTERRKQMTKTLKDLCKELRNNANNVAAIKIVQLHRNWNIS